MGALRLDGRLAAASQKEQLQQVFATLARPLTLAVVLPTADLSSASYRKARERLAKDLGVHLKTVEYDHLPTAHELQTTLRLLCDDSEVDGIMVDRPLPPGVSDRDVDFAIDPDKDVDGCHPINAGRLMQVDASALVPSTALAVLALLRYYHIDLYGKQAVVVGRSKTVGAPTAQLLLQEQATVTVAHSKTKNVRALTQQADLVVVAVGKAELLDESYFDPHATVIDVGIHVLPDGHLCGDVRASVSEHVAAYSPVPGGVGPLTNLALMTNLLHAYQNKGGR